MARTIYGCVDWATGKAVFEGAACDNSDYEGCLEVSGNHIGQVKVIVTDPECSDTYYGCVNWTTGQFQVELPELCCCECHDNGNFIITYSGIQQCEGDEYCEFPSDPNTTFIMPWYKTVSSNEYFGVSENGWWSGLRCRVDIGAIHIDLWTSGNEQVAFQTETWDCDNAPSILDISDCDAPSCETVIGYDGEAAYRWTS